MSFSPGFSFAKIKINFRIHSTICHSMLFIVESRDEKVPYLII